MLDKKLNYYCSAEYPIAMNIERSHGKFELHKHDFTELVVVLNGNAMHCTKNAQYPLNPGSVFMIPPEEYHGYEVYKKEFGIANFIFDLERMPFFDLPKMPGFYRLYAVRHTGKKLISSNPPCLTPEHLKQVAGLINDISRELDSGLPGSQALAVANFVKLVTVITRYNQPAVALTIENIYHETMTETVSFIERHYRENINLTRLSKRAKMSIRNFQRIFSEQFGMTPMQYIMRLRLDKATEELRFSCMNISNIALECGFCDSNYFTRCFRQHRGITPFEYRKQNQKLLR